MSDVAEQLAERIAMAYQVIDRARAYAPHSIRTELTHALDVLSGHVSAQHHHPVKRIPGTRHWSETTGQWVERGEAVFCPTCGWAPGGSDEQ